MKRSKVRNKRKDSRIFANTAERVRSVNVSSSPMRGGIRL